MISFETYMLSADLTKQALLKAKQYADEKAELGFEVNIIDEFPEEPDKNIIYLKPLDDGTEGYSEWIYIPEGDPQWNKIGTTGIDFTNYYTKEETDEIAVSTKEENGEYTNNLINDGSSLIDKQHYCYKTFSPKSYPFVREYKIRAGGTYLLLFNNIQYTDGIYKMYENVGNLYALTDTLTANNEVITEDKISLDRGGIEAATAAAMWLCEPFDNSSTDFKLKNLSNNKYLYNDNGTIAYSSSVSDSDNKYAWRLINRNFEDDVSDTSPYQGTKENHIFTTLTSVSDTTKYIRASNGSNVFKFGSTATPKDGRNGGVYLYRQVNSSYITNLHDVTINRSSDVAYDTTEGIYVTTSSANKDLFTITLPDSEVEKSYGKIIVNYDYITGSRIGFKYQKSDGTEKFENNDNFRFPTNTTSKTITIENNYKPLKKFFIISFATGSQTIIRSITFTDPANITDASMAREYTIEPLSTGTEKASSITVTTDISSTTKQSVYVTNEIGVNTPRWYDATEAVRLNTPYIFSDTTATPNKSCGIGVRVVVSNNQNIASLQSIAYKVEYQSDSAVMESYKNSIIAAHNTSSNNEVALDYVGYGSPSVVTFKGQNGTTVNCNNNNIEISSPDVFVGSGSSAEKGLVPQPPTTSGTTKYLCEDGTWKTVSDTTYTLSSDTYNGESSYGGSGFSINLTGTDGSSVDIGLIGTTDVVNIEAVPNENNLYKISLNPSIQTQLNELAQLKADIDYLAMMTNIDLSQNQTVLPEQ